MKIEMSNGKYIISGSRGYFCFFVDGDSSCWSKKHEFSAAKFNSFDEAQECLIEIKRRDALKRKKKLSRR